MLSGAREDLRNHATNPIAATDGFATVSHFRLVTVRYDYETLPLDYASFQVQVDIGHLTQAIEILVQGRGLLSDLNCVASAPQLVSFANSTRISPLQASSQPPRFSKINLATNRQLKFMHHNERSSPNAPKSSLSPSFSVSSPQRLEVPLPFSHDDIPLASRLRTPTCKSSPRGPAHPYQP